ncbi:MAG: hypothetical protein NT164_02775 [Verrucomicrobiae bacterium]|nr:hypothetical protein [Verrucomicrobiae bacterium]
MNFSPLSFTKSLFVTAFLILALSASSFAGPKKQVEGKEQKVRTQSGKRDATAGAGSSSTKKRGTQSSAVDPSSKQEGRTRTSKTKSSVSADTLRLLNEGLAGSTTSATAGQAVSKAQKVRQTSTGVPTPPGITMSNLPQAKAASAAVEKKLFSSESQKLSSECQQFQVVLRETLAKGKQQPVSNRTIAEMPSLRPSTGVEPSATAAAVADVESKQEEQQKDERGYLTREAFINLLQQDANEWNRQLEEDSVEEGGSDVKAGILTQALNTANRLLAKYNSPEMLLSGLSTEEPCRIGLASIRTFQENSAGDGTNLLPRKKMTPLEFDQEFYEAIKGQATRALEYSENNQRDDLLDSLDHMNYLDSYSQLSFDNASLLFCIRRVILDHYETLIARSLNTEEKRNIWFAPQGQGDANQISGNIVVWNFKKSIEENKELFQAVKKDLGIDFVKCIQGAVLVEKEDAVTLQQPVESMRLPREFVSACNHGQTVVADDAARSLPEVPGAAALSAARSEPRVNNHPNFWRSFRSFTKTSAAIVAAALAYEWYLHHSLSTTSGQAAS